MNFEKSEKTKSKLCILRWSLIVCFQTCLKVEALSKKPNLQYRIYFKMSSKFFSVIKACELEFFKCQIWLLFDHLFIATVY